MRDVTQVFLRLNNRRKGHNRFSFYEAGYPYAVPKTGSWREIHEWCQTMFCFPNGVVTYSWTGEVFWFQTPQDRDVFVARYGNDAPPVEQFKRKARA